MQYFYVKDEENNIKTDIIKAIDEAGGVWFIPNSMENGHWRAYQTWLAADTINNIPQ